MITTYIPKLNDLFFKELMLADHDTMSYNHAYGGTIPFPKERWNDWYNKWIINNEDKRYYRYLKDGNDNFIGEISYHFDDEVNGYLVDVLIYSPYRGKGYGKEALNLLCMLAKENGIDILYDSIAIDNPAITLFINNGFIEIYRNEEFIMVKKVL